MLVYFLVISFSEWYVLLKITETRRNKQSLSTHTHTYKHPPTHTKKVMHISYIYHILIYFLRESDKEIDKPVSHFSLLFFFFLRSHTSINSLTSWSSSVETSISPKRYFPIRAMRCLSHIFCPRHILLCAIFYRENLLPDA